MYNSSYRRNSLLLGPDESLLVILDLQEKFIPAMSQAERLVKNCGVLLQAARRLGIPVLVTEQVPEKLGPTVLPLDAKGGGARKDGFSLKKFSKKVFSAAAHAPFYQAVREAKRPQIIVAGIESHICVQQTVLDFATNTEAWLTVPADAVDSRHPRDWELALEKMRDQGVSIATTEMVLFEWLESAGNPHFKELQKLIL